MIRALTQNEMFIFNMLMESKRKSHKFNVPYLYTVPVKEVKIISHILVSMNISVHIKNMCEDFSEIQIFHMRTKDEAMITYCRKLRLDNDFNINITDEEKETVKKSVDMVFNALRFNDSFDPDI